MHYWEITVAIIIAILVSAKSKQSIKFYVKFVLIYAWVLGITNFLLPFFFLRPKNVKNLTDSSKILKVTTKMIDANYTLRGGDNLSKDQTCVIVANHQSAIDLVGMFEIWPVIDRMTVIAKRELFYVGTFGIAAWLAGLIFIDRKSGKAGQAMNKALVELKPQRIKVWVFPEGTRRNTGEIHPFKKGAFHAAIHAQVPIIPVVFSSYKSFLNTKEKTFESGNVLIEALPEISTIGLKPQDCGALMDRIRSAMITKYDELNHEIDFKR